MVLETLLAALLTCASGSRSAVTDVPVSKALWNLRGLAVKGFSQAKRPYTDAMFKAEGSESFFEQALQYFKGKERYAWNLQWGKYFTQTLEFPADLKMVPTVEWTQMVLQSVVMPEGGEMGLECLKFGACAGTGAPQYLLQALHGDLIPILSLERGSEDDFWSAWMSGDFGAFAAGPGLQKLSALERFNFLGQWMARAYVIAGLGYSPASFHSIIYESLVAGHAVKPLPLPNAYQDADTIQECEWLAGIYGSRRPQELGAYGWQSCDEIQDQSGRYTQESCYKPLYRSKEMWERVAARWPSADGDSKVPFEKAHEYTRLKCSSKWVQDFQGCAPFSETLGEMKCRCPKVWGLWPRMCLSHRQRDGELEEHLDFQTAREIYAGVCSLNTRHIHQRALVIMALLVGSIAAWCVFSGRAAAEMGAAQEEGNHKEAEEAKTDDQLMDEQEQQRQEKQEQQRQEKFNHLVENSESLRDLAFKVSALPEPELQVSFTPIKSNIYRYWALGGKKRSWLHYFGLRFVFLIQLVAPFAILRENYFKWDFQHSKIRFVKYEYGSNTHGVSHLLGRLLEFCFIFCIGLHSLSIIKKASEENSMLASLFDELKRRKDGTSGPVEGTGRKLYVGRWSQTCLLLDCVMICYVITLGLVDMVAIFSDNGGPKDVVFDSLALLFIFHLHEVEGGLTFVSIQDFNERRVGELCARISQATDPDAENSGTQLAQTIQQKLAKKRIVLRTQRRSALFFVTETLIYIILLLVPVFQLFIQDGLQAHSNAISEGTLGAHIVQEEALLAEAMKSLKKS